MESDSDFKNDLTSSDESVSLNNIPKPLVCTYKGCKASFYKNNRLVYHLRKHSGERPFACNIGDCKKAYTNNTHLRRHMKTHEPKPEKLLCPIEGCGKILATTNTLKTHLIRWHEQTKSYPFTCAECQQGFKKKKQLQQHSYLHTGVLPFHCEICYEQFQTITGLSRHKSRHKSYTCVCEKVFGRWSLLRAHKKNCQKIDYICKICEKSFKNSTALHGHVKGHLETYNCPREGCDRVYNYKKNLDYHIRFAHENIKRKKIPCTVEGCSAKLSKMQNLKIHLEKIHSENREATKPIIRAPRKDKGSFHKSTAIELASLKLHKEDHQILIDGGKIDVDKLIGKKADDCESEHCSINKSETDKNVGGGVFELKGNSEFFENSCKEIGDVQENINPMVKTQ